MSIISKAVKNAASYSLSDFEKDFYRHFYGGWKSTSGVVVNEETAMKFSALFACVRIISEDIGMLPIEIRRWRDPRNPSKGSDLAYELPLFDTMLYETNPEMHSMLFDETFQSHILLSGNAYAYKLTDSRGRVTGLKLLDWYDVKPERNGDTGLIEYKFNDRGKELVFNFNEIFHIPGLGYDGICGYSPVKMAMDAIGLGIAAEQFASYFYSNGANVGGVITMPGQVADKEALKKELRESWGGLAKSHQVMVLEEGMTFNKLVMPLQEAQFIETRKFQVIEIARIYRMPLKMIQDHDRSTFSNEEQQDLDYGKHTLLPWAERWEKSIDTRLLTKADRVRGYFSKFNFDELLRADSKSRAEANHIKRQDGVMSANEWRVQDSMNPRPEPEADELYINSTMVPLKMAGKIKNTGGGGKPDEEQVLEDPK